MPHGKVAEHNTRTLLTISKEFKAEVEKVAKEEGKSFNALVIEALNEYMERR